MANKKKPHPDEGRLVVQCLANTGERAARGVSVFVRDIRGKGQRWNTRYKIKRKGFRYHLYQNTIIITEG